MAQLDATAVNVAMPSIGRSLGGGISGLQWVADGYVLVLACLGMSGGGLGDRYGRRRVYRAGLMVFSLGSLGCSLAPGLSILVIMRMVQGIGAAMLMPVTLSIITNTFHAPAARARAIGTWAGVAGVAAGVGPLVGGTLTAELSWRAIFWINLPIGTLALALTGRIIPESRSVGQRGFDLTGQILLAGTLATLTYALIEASAAGWTSFQTLTLLGAAAIGGVCFATAETRARGPMIDPRHFRDRAFAGASVIAALIYLAVMGILFLSSLYLQQVRGLSPLATGAALLPTSLTLAAAGPLAGRLTARHGPRLVLAAATSCLIAGTVLLLRTTPSTTPALLAISYLLIGAGWGLANPPLTNVAISAMPRDRAGVASATVGVSRQLGAVLGVAVLGSLTTTRTRALLHIDHRIQPIRPLQRATSGTGPSARRAASVAFTTATHSGYAVAMGAILIGLVIVIVTIPKGVPAISASNNGVHQ